MFFQQSYPEKALADNKKIDDHERRPEKVAKINLCFRLTGPCKAQSTHDQAYGTKIKRINECQDEAPARETDQSVRERKCENRNNQYKFQTDDR